MCYTINVHTAIKTCIIFAHPQRPPCEQREPARVYFFNLMNKTYKYRLYPSNSQRRKLQGILNAARWIYNKTLEVRKTAWEERKESLSLYDTIKMIPEWKVEHEWLAEQAHSQVLQNVCVRVDLAFSAFFRRVKEETEKVGYPGFRGAHRYDSFTFPQSGLRLIENGRLRLSKVGDVKVKLHRPICGEINTLTVRRDALGNWWATFACEHEPDFLPKSNKMVGVDVGLSHFLTTDQGQHVDNPRFFRKEEEAIAKAQRQLSKHKIGSPIWLKKKRVVQHIHKHITNKRRDFAHQLSRTFVNKLGLTQTREKLRQCVNEQIISLGLQPISLG